MAQRNLILTLIMRLLHRVDTGIRTICLAGCARFSRHRRFWRLNAGVAGRGRRDGVGPARTWIGGGSMILAHGHFYAENRVCRSADPQIDTRTYDVFGAETLFSEPECGMPTVRTQPEARA